MNRRHSFTHARTLLAFLLFLFLALAACKGKGGGRGAGTEGQAVPAGEPSSKGATAAPPAAAGTATPGAANPGEVTRGAAVPGTPEAAAAVDPSTLPATVADVGGSKITREELARGVQAAQAKMARVGQRVLPNLDTYRQVLDELVMDRVLQKEAKAAGIVASDAEVEAQLAMIRSRLPSPEAYKQVLAANGVSEARFKESLASGIAKQRYVETKLVPAEKVTDPEVREYYDKNRPKFVNPEAVHVRHVMVKVDQGASPADKAKAREKAEALLKRIQGGEDFAQLAQQNSDDPGSKANGGDVGWMPRGKMVPAFDKAAFALAKPGDLSPVVETEFGFHLIQMIERRATSVVELDQVKGKILQFLQNRRAFDALRQRIAAQREKGKIKVFV
jgi:peptidyl-prolyl cis-trans isomerase C